jgi:hypothetical protein
MPSFGPISSAPISALPESGEAPVGSTITGVSISPTTATGATTFTAIVSGTGSFSTAKTFSKISGGGSINAATGAFTPPAQTGSTQVIVVRATSTQDPGQWAEATITIAAAPPESGVTLATYIYETFASRAAIPWANLSGMRWYFFDQAPPAALGAPVAQGALETTDSSGACLFDIAGLTSLTPGQIGTLAFTNSNGNPEQTDLISWFSPVVVR